MSSDPRDSGLPQSLEDVRRWLVQAGIVPGSAFARTSSPPDLPELPDVLADIEALPDPTAGRRLREIETEIAAMQPGPARDAALRDGIRNLTSQIERLDPEDEGDLLGLWGQIDTARDQAAALALFRDRPDLVTDGIRAAVVHRALELNGSPPFSDGSIGLADALVNSIPFLDSFTTGQLEALQASADNLPDGYPQAFQGKDRHQGGAGT